MGEIQNRMVGISTIEPCTGYVESRRGGRPENQDWLGFKDTPHGLLVVVCDGMGGGPGGRTASTIAVQTIIDAVASATPTASRSDVLQQAIGVANARLLAMQQETPALRGMGTTVTAILLNAQSAVLAHVGDSRIYQFRFGRIVFRTADHSLVAEQVRAGMMTEEQARTASNSNIITRALGLSPDVTADITERPYDKGDRFLLCTDGVWGAMPEGSLIRMVAQTKSKGGAVEKTMITVEELGQATGGHHDNFTMALLETTCNSNLVEKMTHKTRNLMLTLGIICLVSLALNVWLIWNAVDPNKENTQPDPAKTEAQQNKSDASQGIEDDTQKPSNETPATEERR